MSKDFILELNGKAHARGDLNYLAEVIKDYLQNLEAYGKESADFKIESLPLYRKRFEKVL